MLGRFLFLGDYKIEGLTFEGGKEVFENHWNSPLYSSNSPEIFGYLFNGEIVLDDFESLPFRGYGELSH